MTHCQMGVPGFQGKEKFRVQPPAKTCSCFRLMIKMIYDPPGGSIDLQFHLLPDLVLVIIMVSGCVCGAVLDLIYWRDVKKTSVVFGSTLVLLLSLALFSVLSVVAYLSLVTLTITISYRVYRSTLSSLQKTGQGHPFQSVLLLGT